MGYEHAQWNIAGGSNNKPHTGDGKTTRDIYDGKVNVDRNNRKGYPEIVYRDADGKPTN